jgi:hypothetical protein
MSSGLSRIVAGHEKILIGLIAAIQTYVASVDWLVDPEKAFAIAILGLGQIWLGADSPTPEPTHPDDDSNPVVLSNPESMP